MGSSARHLEDYDSPVKVAEMKKQNLADYRRWIKEAETLQEAIHEVKTCGILTHKRLILKSLDESLDKKRAWISDQIEHWRYRDVCPEEVKGFA
jgi:hypothetical protein